MGSIFKKPKVSAPAAIKIPDPPKAPAPAPAPVAVPLLAQDTEALDRAAKRKRAAASAKSGVAAAGMGYDGAAGDRLGG